MKIERRYAPGLEIRAEGDNPPKIVGYASIFNQPAQVGPDSWGWTEIVKPGAFRRALTEMQDVRALVNHDSASIIGRLSAGTLVLREDTKGLYYEVTVPDTQVGRDVLTSVKRGDITGSSFGFRVKTDKNYILNGKDMRELLDLDLIEVSPVSFPAYDGTSAQARALFSEEQQENLLRTLYRAQRGLDLSPEDDTLLAEIRTWLDKATAPATPHAAILQELQRRKQLLRLKYAA